MIDGVVGEEGQDAADVQAAAVGMQPVGLGMQLVGLGHLLTRPQLVLLPNLECLIGVDEGDRHGQLGGAAGGDINGGGIVCSDEWTCQHVGCGTVGDAGEGDGEVGRELGREGEEEKRGGRGDKSVGVCEVGVGWDMDQVVEEDGGCGY